MSFVIEHRARRSGKTHEIVDRSLALLLNGKRNNLFLYSYQIEPIKAILSVNNQIDYEEWTKTPSRGGERWNKGKKNIFLLRHYEAIEPIDIPRYNDLLLSFDEFPFESNLLEAGMVLKNLKKVGSDNVIILTTSHTSGFSKTIFDIFRKALKHRKDLDVALRDTLATLERHFSEEVIIDNCRRIMESCYAYTDFEVEQKVKNYLFDAARDITNKSELFRLDSYVKSSSRISRDFFGMFFEDKAMTKAGYRSYEEIMTVLKNK